MAKSKLEQLAEIEGYDDMMELLEAASTDSVVPAICTNDECDYTEYLEPDMRDGHCSECAQNSMKSCLVLANII